MSAEPGASRRVDPVLLADTSATREWVGHQRATGASIALVPTMGALHDGHLELVRVAHDHADVVVVSVFVNPLQFDRADDLDRYPRTWETDLAQCRDAGVDAIFAPEASAMYPDGFDTTVVPGRLASRLEGEHRPGHFSGVATVVTKLFVAVRPDVAVFGRKDAQQLAIVQRLAIDLDLGVEIIGVPTVRETDGLARSSRNLRLSPTARRTAGRIPRALAACRSAAADGERSPRALEQLVVESLRRDALAAPPIEVEYVWIVDPGTFDPVDELDDRSLVVLAAWVDGVRLIDNTPALGTDTLDALDVPGVSHDLGDDPTV